MSAKDDPNNKPSCSKDAYKYLDKPSTSKGIKACPAVPPFPVTDVFQMNTLLQNDKMKNLFLAHPELMKIPSLMPPRDLTLLGPTKKVYAPNLNVKRNKNLTVKTSKDTTPRASRGGRVDKEKGRGGGRGGSTRGGRGGRGGAANLVQTTGVFSEGIGAPVVKKLSSSKRYQPSDETSSTMTRPIISKSSKNQTIIPKDLPASFDEKEDEEDFFDDLANSTDLPVMLKQRKTPTNIEKISSESQDPNATTTDVETSQSRVEPLKIPKPIHKIFESPDAMTFVMQLPDSLPFETCDLMYDEPAKKGGDGTRSNLCTTKPLPKAISLSRFNDGKIGKLVRYKSGKVKLVIGPNRFDIIMGINTNLTQQLMSISANKDEKIANIIQLGSIDTKVTAVPDWRHMLHELDLKMNPKVD